MPPRVKGKMIRDILVKSYATDTLYYTVVNDNWGIGGRKAL
jgi:hypothetical protein